MIHKTQLHSKMFLSQVGHCNGAATRGPSWGPLLCAPSSVPAAQIGGGSATWHLVKIRLLRILLPSRAKHELSFCRKTGVKVSLFLFIFDQEQQLSVVCMGLDALWAVQAKSKNPQWFPDVCAACVTISAWVSRRLRVKFAAQS